jgi:hypothetical protein
MYLVHGYWLMIRIGGIQKAAIAPTLHVHTQTHARFAERGGFEPPVLITQNNGFRDRRIRPLCHLSSGERGIRTPGSVTGTTVFKTAAFDRSAISPLAGKNTNISEPNQYTG